MALNTRSSIDPRWFTHNQSVGYGLQVTTVRVYNPSAESQTYDPVTNTFSGNATDLYIGPARVQPVSPPTDTSETYNPTNLQSVRVVLPFGKNELEGSAGVVPDIRPNDKLVVTSSPYNDALEKFSYMVIGVMNSSNAWERTLMCRVDMEIDPTNA